MKTFKGFLKELPENGIYVFFSNIEGKHESGAAKVSYEKFGAVWGKAFHSMGQSYAICVKWRVTAKDIKFMQAQIETLYYWCKKNKESDFYVMCNAHANLGEYTPDEMVKVFKSHPIPENIVFEEGFAKLITGQNLSRRAIEMEV